MESLLHADIFFVVSTIGFCLLAILGAIVLVYLILILARWHRISKKIEIGVESVSAEAKELFTTAIESRFLTWLFGKKKKRGHKT